MTIDLSKVPENEPDTRLHFADRLARRIVDPHRERRHEPSMLCLIEAEVLLQLAAGEPVLWIHHGDTVELELTMRDGDAAQHPKDVADPDFVELCGHALVVLRGE